MKIVAGTLITESLTARLLKQRKTLGPFADPNEMRLHVAGLPGIPAADWSDFGRGGTAVRRMMLAAAFTAIDHGGDLPPELGVIGWNGDGCTAENLRFWRDYVGCGRESGRGGLFVATLPTIPFCEAAIAFGWKGPSAYLRTEQSTQTFFRLFSNRPKGKYLIGEMTRETVCTLLLDTALAGPEFPDHRSFAELFSHLEEPA